MSTNLRLRMSANHLILISWCTLPLMAPVVPLLISANLLCLMSGLCLVVQAVLLGLM